MTTPNPTPDVAMIHPPASLRSSLLRALFMNNIDEVVRLLTDGDWTPEDTDRIWKALWKSGQPQPLYTWLADPAKRAAGWRLWGSLPLEEQVLNNMVYGTLLSHPPSQWSQQMHAYWEAGSVQAAMLTMALCRLAGETSASWSLTSSHIQNWGRHLAIVMFRSQKEELPLLDKTNMVLFEEAPAWADVFFEAITTSLSHITTDEYASEAYCQAVQQKKEKVLALINKELLSASTRHLGKQPSSSRKL